MTGPGEEWAGRIEATGQVPGQLWAELRERGFLRMAAPCAYGGHGLSFTQWMGLMEIFSRSHGSLRMVVHVVNGIWRAMDPFATEEQRKKFVLPAIEGDIKIAFTLTEPGNGTGADITASVVREGDTYYLTGDKHLITFGVSCDYYLLAAASRAPQGTRAPSRCSCPGTPRACGSRTPPGPWGSPAPTTPPSTSRAPPCPWPTASARRARAWTWRSAAF
ncbi:acyl-CoA/acyl-ACP dehydrogenase [Streptomyces sp. NBC_01795]|uniref:acyl-CoA dehydrogenase family protein n=1 Tax=Streptomyces sp. NBC_01795 TaxID=2975943 RepID=UPI002DD8D986|nr:acyl-CoA dehydrogenase family protein [Streptomyces sp. NBC_01795]WSA91132.1 acyl-CoA/acyl-ACP dehydrogenase [Streptomyces sp. NBC_01795]